MIVKVQPSRKHASSFKRLREYLTQERDAETAELVLRGDVVLSWNLLSFDTAAGEMQGVASLNDRCKDAVCHYELAWPPGERPTRPQWTDSAVQTLKGLGYEDHQYMVVAHDDKKHFHIHIMVNKVHPQTLRAPTRYNNWLALDAAARFLEAKYGWAHTPGMTRWDEESKQAVRLSRSERNALLDASWTELQLPEQVGLVAAQIIRIELVRRLVEVLCEPLDEAQITPRRTGRVVATRELFEHHFAKMSHSVLPPVTHTLSRPPNSSTATTAATAAPAASF